MHWQQKHLDYPDYPNKALLAADCVLSKTVHSLHKATNITTGYATGASSPRGLQLPEQRRKHWQGAGSSIEFSSVEGQRKVNAYTMRHMLDMLVDNTRCNTAVIAQLNQ